MLKGSTCGLIRQRKKKDSSGRPLRSCEGRVSSWSRHVRKRGRGLVDSFAEEDAGCLLLSFSSPVVVAHVWPETLRINGPNCVFVLI